MRTLGRPAGGTAPRSDAARGPGRDLAPALVTLHLWRVPRRRIGAALRRVATDRFALRRAPGALFVRLLGTGAGRTFSLRDAQPDRWALLVAWAGAEDAATFEGGQVAGRWAALAAERWRVELAPLGAHGRWSGRAPFGAERAPGSADGRAGPVAALTRSRLRWRRAGEFWRAVPAVAADLGGRGGLLFAAGIAERPVGVQGTFSVWESAGALRDFAYRGAAHQAAIGQAAARGWFAEELFARFAVLGASGTVDGRDPLTDAGWGERVASAP